MAYPLASLVVKKTIGKNYKTDTSKAEGIIQQDGTRLIVKYNVQDVMCLNMESSMFLVIN
jgi:uncharacterized protein YycO